MHYMLSEINRDCNKNGELDNLTGALKEILETPTSDIYSNVYRGTTTLFKVTENIKADVVIFFAKELNLIDTEIEAKIAVINVENLRIYSSTHSNAFNKVEKLVVFGNESEEKIQEFVGESIKEIIMVPGEASCKAELFFEILHNQRLLNYYRENYEDETIDTGARGEASDINTLGELIKEKHKYYIDSCHDLHIKKRICDEMERIRMKKEEFENEEGQKFIKYTANTRYCKVAKHFEIQEICALEENDEVSHYSSNYFLNKIAQADCLHLDAPGFPHSEEEIFEYCC